MQPTTGAIVRLDTKRLQANSSYDGSRGVYTMDGSGWEYDLKNVEVQKVFAQTSLYVTGVDAENNMVQLSMHSGEDAGWHSVKALLLLDDGKFTPADDIVPPRDPADGALCDDGCE